MQKTIENILKDKGPLTGAELLSETDMDKFELWKRCELSKNITVHRIGQRYLRLDKYVKGYARLSPSILREFLTYSIIGLKNETNLTKQKIEKVISHTKNISIYKLNIAKQFVSYIIQNYTDTLIKNNMISVVLAGDIVYNMAHNVPRPERSTGKMVKGSDLDLIFILDTNVPENILSELDESVYNLKYQYLINPAVKEEIDYIVKTTDKIKNQMEFNSFKKMIACKILQEGILIAGSDKLFKTVKKMLDTYGVNAKLDNMLKSAAEFRKKTRELLLKKNIKKPNAENNYIFYTAEESEEFD